MNVELRSLAPTKPPNIGRLGDWELDKDTNITLTGFMGTGKTTTGQLLAERLDRDFVDMDDEGTNFFLRGEKCKWRSQRVK